jgi:hypothetical protein
MCTANKLALLKVSEAIFPVQWNTTAYIWHRQRKETKWKFRTLNWDLEWRTPYKILDSYSTTKKKPASPPKNRECSLSCDHSCVGNDCVIIFASLVDSFGLSVSRIPCSGHQGCQMVCFQTKYPNLGKFWRALEWKIFNGRWKILRSFGIFNRNLVMLW